MVSWVQEAQQDTIASFQAFMDECMEADWANDKRQLFDAALPGRAYSHGSTANLSGPSSSMALAPLRSAQSFPGGPVYPTLQLIQQSITTLMIVRHVHTVPAAKKQAVLNRQCQPRRAGAASLWAGEGVHRSRARIE